MTNGPVRGRPSLSLSPEPVVSVNVNLPNFGHYVKLGRTPGRRLNSWTGAATFTRPGTSSTELP